MQLIVTVHHLPATQVYSSHKFMGKFTTVQCKFFMGLWIPHNATVMLMRACDKCDACRVAAGSQDKKLLATHCEHTSMAYSECDAYCWQSRSEAFYHRL